MSNSFKELLLAGINRKLLPWCSMIVFFGRVFDTYKKVLHSQFLSLLACEMAAFASALLETHISFSQLKVDVSA